MWRSLRGPHGSKHGCLRSRRSPRRDECNVFPPSSLNSRRFKYAFASSMCNIRFRQRRGIICAWNNACGSQICLRSCPRIFSIASFVLFIAIEHSGVAKLAAFAEYWTVWGESWVSFRLVEIIWTYIFVRILNLMCVCVCVCNVLQVQWREKTKTEGTKMDLRSVQQRPRMKFPSSLFGHKGKTLSNWIGFFRYAFYFWLVMRRLSIRDRIFVDSRYTQRLCSPSKIPRVVTLFYGVHATRSTAARADDRRIACLSSSILLIRTRECDKCLYDACSE